jgi:hypothetical protein
MLHFKQNLSVLAENHPSNSKILNFSDFLFTATIMRMKLRKKKMRRRLRKSRILTKRYALAILFPFVFV